ncbi:MAG: tyrosine--tRNA ligase [Alphaproteobacteria bacterium]|jgi:tyrosyl-tRNA synthetase|nr:tyrosine--tRNA ligase [Alphaproteobacteria bacterium]
MNFKSDFLNFLQERGFIHQCSSFEGLDEKLEKEKIKAYIGFDCTANSLHVGSLIQILLLRHFQRFGHTPVALLGGGTSVVGDPSGRDESRKMLSLEDINTNMLGIRNVLEKFLSFEGSNAAQLMNNADWLCSFNYLEFLRDFGTSFTINRMLAFDSVKIRLQKENPMTFLEFNYMLLQAVDFFYLNKNHDIVLQMGGSDQWGNIINGVELVRRLAQKEVFALTSPLLTKADGSKMGKTAGGAVWLDDGLFSSWDFYQYFRNTDDADVIKFLKLFTELPMSEIETLAKLQGQEINEAKKILAFEITKLVHGEEQAILNQNTAINTFEKGGLDENLPTFFVEEAQLNEGIPLVNFLVSVGFTTSNGEGRKLIINSGIKINDTTITDVAYLLGKKDLHDSTMKVSMGKKKHILVKVQ